MTRATFILLPLPSLEGMDIVVAREHGYTPASPQLFFQYQNHPQFVSISFQIYFHSLTHSLYHLIFL
ncbi:hypothetical protein QVD17_14732 [Tagetes erecta]|uniref:Uncharacterized protein n=1 Tax=Tagetes erecta TaxID=13708 RepID=A0AAD8NYY6_TARER|nr:hypothetical protein QVD17_14732 [Tagetes erecta]